MSNGSSMPQESRDFGREIERSPSFWVWQESEDFIAARFGRMKVRMLLDVVDQAILILPHLEKVVVFAELARRGVYSPDRARLDIFFGPEPFIERAVPSSVVILINQFLIVELLKVSLNDGFVLEIGRPDEGIVRDVEPFPEV